MQSNNDEPDGVIATGGELLPDGTSLHLVQDPTQPNGLALLRWKAGEVQVSSMFIEGGRSYVPLALDPSLRRALRLPRGCASFDSKVYEDLLVAGRDFTSLEGDSLEIVISAYFASWVPEWIQIPVVIALYSPFPDEISQVLRFSSCICRHALALSGGGPAGP